MKKYIMSAAVALMALTFVQTSYAGTVAKTDNIPASVMVNELFAQRKHGYLQYIQNGYQLPPKFNPAGAGFANAAEALQFYYKANDQLKLLLREMADGVGKPNADPQRHQASLGFYDSIAIKALCRAIWSVLPPGSSTNIDGAGRACY